jgi:uncharacterized protein (TIGR00369 family)
MNERPKGVIVLAMKVNKKQSLSHDCIVCGVDNPYGVHASFYEMEDGSLIALFHFDKNHQSYPERTHGGMIAALIDETIGRAVWIKDPTVWGVTMRLNIEYHKPVPYGVPLKCVGKIDKLDKMTFHGVAEIETMDGVMLARGSALYMNIPLSKITLGENEHPDDINVEIPDDIKEID